ncbi:hypothetical protein OH77DRAFT_1421736 [Trametes cingulata]|nr:hypothetical protein OH77DRAFT_1421736 [Trametes cingulata]
MQAQGLPMEVTTATHANAYTYAILSRSAHRYLRNADFLSTAVLSAMLFVVFDLLCNMCGLYVMRRTLLCVSSCWIL